MATIPCEFCGKMYPSVRELKIHAKQHQNLNLPCETCGKVFNTKNHLHNHWVNVHKPKDPAYKRIQYSTCDLCGKKYRRKMDVIKHKRDEHKFITAEEQSKLAWLESRYDSKSGQLLPQPEEEQLLSIQHQ